MDLSDLKMEEARHFLLFQKRDWENPDYCMNSGKRSLMKMSHF